MRILLTNDDGIDAPGLRALAAVARKFGEVKVVAPDRERSACGHAMTIRDPLRAKTVEYDGLEAMVVNGVPVDCVNVALTLCWPDGCDLVMSGFNNGPNLGFDVTYSGTVAGAMEGTINGIRSLSLSMVAALEDAPMHYETGAAWLEANWGLVTGAELPEGTFLNVNVPAVALPEVHGHRFTRMGKRIWEDRVEERSDPWGRSYFWQGGATMLRPEEEGTDVKAVAEGYVSITPVRIDWTDEATLDRLAASVAATV
ncbi:MAG: 5'/3'-nucleotidase SurE [Fimbriimonadaceae bacterium]|nr:5'/3'-nucleotidase SurE [Fimbriimonadaceae bacterium]